MLYSNGRWRKPCRLLSFLLRFFRLSYCRVFLFYLVFLAVTVSSAYAVELKLGWWPNTEPDLQGYRVYYGAESGSYTNVVDVGNPVPVNGVIVVVLPHLSPFSTYYLAVKAFNDKEVPSDFSPEIVWSYPDYTSGSGDLGLEVFVNSDYLDGEVNNCFSTVTQGYGAVEDFGAVYICVGEYCEDLHLNQDKRVILSGAWVDEFSSNESSTTNICGSMIISNGMVEVEGVVISSGFN